MVYQLERDDGRPEVRQGIAGTIVHWPKVDGIGNVLVSATPGDNRAEIRSNSGAVLQGEANVTGTTVGGVTRFDIAVSPIADLTENAFLVLKFTPDSGTHGAAEAFERVVQVEFDVVLQPWGQSSVGINDLEARVRTITAYLQRQVDVLDPAGTAGLTVAMLASDYGHQAHADLYRRIRRVIAKDAQTKSPHYTRPRLIIDRQALHPCEVAIALHMIFESDIATSIAGQDADNLAKYWRVRSDEYFGDLIPLSYDLNEDRVPDTELRDFGGVVMARRRQSF